MGSIVIDLGLAHAKQAEVDSAYSTRSAELDRKIAELPDSNAVSQLKAELRLMIAALSPHNLVERLRLIRQYNELIRQTKESELMGQASYHHAKGDLPGA